MIILLYMVNHTFNLNFFLQNCITGLVGDIIGQCFSMMAGLDYGSIWADFGSHKDRPCQLHGQWG